MYEVQLEKTFSQQLQVPKLTVPDLNQTIECFLQSVRPFIHNSEDDKRIKKLATELASNPSILARQEFLRMLAADTDTNWLSSGGKNDIWIRAAYHSWVDLPLPCNSNVCGWMFLEKEWELEPTFSAAATVMAYLTYKIDLDNGNVPINRARDGKPEDMFQYSRIFGMTRVPSTTCDYFVQDRNSKHIVVFCCNIPYKINVLSENNNILMDIGSLRNIFQYIILDTKHQSHNAKFGALTGMERSKWAKVREQWIKNDPEKKDALHWIESAITVLNLDVLGNKEFEDFTSLTRRFLHYNNENRWFDKSFQIIVNPAGQVGVNVEHSWAEASVLLQIHSTIIYQYVANEYKKRRNLRNDDGELLKVDDLLNKYVHRLDAMKTFSPETIEQIDYAVGLLNEINNNSDLAIIPAYEYPATTLKQVGVSPDSILQLAIQLGYYRMHKKTAATYETVVLTAFRNGRTGTCRTVCTETVEFCKAMVHGNKKKIDLQNDFKKAAKAHISYVIKASNGKGCDRHMLALRFPLDHLGEGVPGPGISELWSDPLFNQSQSWMLSTSNNSYLLNGCGCFGSVNPLGYGVGYLSASTASYFAIECKNETKDTSSIILARYCIEALEDIHNLFDVMPVTVKEPWVANAKL